jgi:hypothetical protein
MRRQKKDWTSAYAKVTKARGEEKKKHRHGITRKNTESKCAGRRKTGPPPTRRWPRREGRKRRSIATD